MWRLMPENTLGTVRLCVKTLFRAVKRSDQVSVCLDARPEL